MAAGVIGYAAGRQRSADVSMAPRDNPSARAARAVAGNASADAGFRLFSAP